MAKTPTVHGRPALDIAGGVVLQPLRKLTGHQGRTLYADMSRDPILSGLLLGTVHAACATNWWWDPDDNATSDGHALFVEDCFKAMRPAWSDILVAVLRQKLVYGFTLFEPLYHAADGKVGWAGLSPRHPASVTEWLSEPMGSSNIVAAVQRTLQPGQPEAVIPLDKLLHFRTDLADPSPEGRSALLGSVEPWFRKTNIAELESIGVERDFAGIPMFEVPAEWLSRSATPTQKLAVDQYQTIGRNLRVADSTCLVMPQFYEPAAGGEMVPQVKFSLIAAPGGGSKMFDTSAVIMRYNTEMAMSWLGDWLIMGHDKVGTQTLSLSKIELWASTINGWLDRIATVMTDQAAARLLRLNGLDGPPPKLMHTPVRSVDLAVLGAYVTALAGAGVLTVDPGGELENTLRAFAELPEIDPEVVMAAQLSAEKAKAQMAAGLQRGGSNPDNADDLDEMG